jgi:hypothetical protein
VDCRPTCRWLWKRPICLLSIQYNMTTQEKHRRGTQWQSPHSR